MQPSSHLLTFSAKSLRLMKVTQRKQIMTELLDQEAKQKKRFNHDDKQQDGQPPQKETKMNAVHQEEQIKEMSDCELLLADENTTQ